MVCNSHPVDAVEGNVIHCWLEGVVVVADAAVVVEVLQRQAPMAYHGYSTAGQSQHTPG